MPDSSTRARAGGPTAVVIGLLIVVMIVASLLLVGIGGGSDGRQETTKARSERPDHARADSTTSTTTRAPFTYTVKPGNTLTDLALFFGVSTADVIAANPDLDPDHLVEGQRLVIPSPRVARLVVRPRTTVVGGSLRLKLTGANEFENITLEIQRPTTPFVGPSHSASQDGVVTTTYELGLADPPGTYTVVATGDRGTSVQTTFLVEAADP